MRTTSLRLVRGMRLLAFPFLTLSLVAATLVATAPRDAVRDDAVRLVAQPASPTFTAFTLNVAHTLNATRARQDILKALTTMGAHAGGFQEFSGDAHRTALREIADQHNWGYYMPEDGNWGGSIPIVWSKSRFTLLEGRKVMVHDRLGGDPARHVNSVRLRENATGKVFGVLNAHTISGGSHDAQPHDQNGNNARTGRLMQHLKVLKQEILRMHRLTEHVVAVGDLNINYNADVRRRVAGFPTRVLGPLVSFNMPLGQPSFGNPATSKSLLDYNMSVKTQRGSGLVPQRNWIERGFHSDHDAVVATYRVRDLLATAPILNRPNAKPFQRRAVLERMARVVQNTEPGAELRMVTPSLQFKPLYNALRAAHARGVAVKVILDRRRPTAQENALVAALGTDTTQPSWAKLCAGSCGSSKGELQANFLLANATGGARNLVLNTQGYTVKAAQRQATDAFIVTDAAVYAGFLDSFNRMVAGTDQRNAPDGVALGGYRVAFRPVTDNGRDVLDRAMKRTKCARGGSPRNQGNRTDVFVAMGDWGGKRGKALARHLVLLKRNQGCTVRVVVDPQVRKPIRAILRQGGVPVRVGRTQQALMLVDGRFRKQSNSQIAWSGSQGWTGKGLRGEGVTLRVDNRQHVVAYRQAFNRLWQNARAL